MRIVSWLRSFLTSNKEPKGKAVQPGRSDAPPARPEFNIGWKSVQNTDSDLPRAYKKRGKVIFGEWELSFEEYHADGDEDDYASDRQWVEAAKRLLSGHDRTAFYLPSTEERLPVWREGEMVYTTLAPEQIPRRWSSHVYEDIKSLPPKDSLRGIRLQAVRDYLSSRGLTRGHLEELGRPCATCGQEMRRCNKCTQCLNCRGGLGDEEYGYCVECEKIGESAEEPPAVENVKEPALVNEEPSASADEDAPSVADLLECGEDGPSYAISQLRDDSSNQRKLFLAGCAWARRFWERLGRRSRTSVEVFERFADGEATYGEFMIAFTEAGDAWHAATAYMDEPDAERQIVLPARGVLSVGRRAYMDASDEFFMARGDHSEYEAQCDIIRDIFGYPSRPVSLDASWLAANEGAAAKLAQAIYDERAFDRLPELADLLEKGGCKHRQILEHCRAQREHVRGCWVLDLLLGKDKIKFPLGA